MIIVTGGAGFIGSNLVRALNDAGERRVLVVDDLTDGNKFRNLADCDIDDYLDRDEFRDLLRSGRLPAPRAVLHMGACSSTTEWDGRYMMDVNYAYSRDLIGYCTGHGVPLIYASSASVYGAGPVFVEAREHEAPLNVYGFSKFQFDQYVRRQDWATQVVGLRFFNVYGPREFHKGGMASVALHLHRQLLEGDVVRLFEGCDGYADGEQLRDFIHVDDVADVVLWFLQHADVSGIYNVGSGRAQSFNDVARAVIDWHGRGRIEYMPFPDHLRGRYQSYTQADLAALRAAGYERQAMDVAAGVRRYLDWLAQHPGALHAGANHAGSV